MAQKSGEGKITREGTSETYLRQQLARTVFFQQCDAQSEGTEPDWDDHLKVINRSRASGQADL